MTYATSSRILLVEDADLIGERLGEALEEEGYAVVRTTSGPEAATLIQAIEESAEGFTFELMILNLRRPQLNALDVCRWVRLKGNPVPILIISDKASDADIVLGLEMGADDYLSRPFGKRELMARIRAKIRRQRQSFLTQTPVLQYRDVIVYPQEGRVLVRRQEIHLPPQEFRLLVLLMSYPHQAWSRSQLLNQLWGANFTGNTKTLDVHIRRLREKLELDPSQPEYIITVEGLGYRFG
jgi:two-component system phosphate regulon response regulator PhoB